MLSQRKHGISELRHRVALCTQKDVVLNEGELKLNRKLVLWNWAAISNKNASMMTHQGADFRGDQERRSHVILMRYRADILISNMTWIYEWRRKSAPRWYKIVALVEDNEEYWRFNARLIQRADDINEPEYEGPARGLPDGVVL